MRAAGQRLRMYEAPCVRGASEASTCFFEPAGHWSLQNPWQAFSRTALHIAGNLRATRAST